MKTHITNLFIAIVMIMLFGNSQAQTTDTLYRNETKNLDLISVFPTLSWDGNINILSNTPIEDIKVYSYIGQNIVQYYIYEKETTEYTTKVLIPESGTFLVSILTQKGNIITKIIIIQ